MPSPFGKGPLEGQQYIAYLDLSGGRNTKRDPHALDRNQLAVSDNTWMAQGNTIQKRPGSVSLPGISMAISIGHAGAVSGYAVGSGVGASGMAEGRFSDVTALVVQTSSNELYGAPLTLPAISGVNTWISLGAVSAGAGPIFAAQLYDPLGPSPTPDGTLFITDGVDTPKKWDGPGHVLAALPTVNLPQKNGLAAPITPKYCATLFSSLFYAGEPSDPSMVYISNPFNPQLFTTNILVPTNTMTTSTYIGAPVGRGDGVNGGAITGLMPMGGAMIVYKESAIYSLTQMGILGDMVWGATVVSSSTGCVSPRSLVAFDTFHVYLGIDGVYTFNGSTTQRISDNNPDLFDGPTAQIQNRATAVGVRYGLRYILFFDNGSGNATSPGSTALGYPNVGAWFDFGKPDVDGLPAAGTFSGMNVNGVAPLRGANDLGNFAWADAQKDRIGVFNATVNGVPAYADFGSFYTVTVEGKADFMDDVWPDEGPVDVKQVDSIHLLMSFPITTAGQTYTFSTTLTLDQYNTLMATVNSTALPNPGGWVWGSAIIGITVIGNAVTTPAYERLFVPQPTPAEGAIVQVQFTETSANPFTCLGYLVLANRQHGVRGSSG